MKIIRRIILFLFIVILGLQIPVSANSETDSAVRLHEKSAALPDDSNEKQLIDTSDMTVPEESMDNKSNATLQNSDQKTAYITIDDGPSRNNTLKNLDTLKKYDIKATFFVLPNDNMDDIYKRIIEEGHVVGNHGCVHDYTSLYGSIM